MADAAAVAEGVRAAELLQAERDAKQNLDTLLARARGENASTSDEEIEPDDEGDMRSVDAELICAVARVNVMHEQRHDHERHQVDRQQHAERGDADGERRGVAGVQHGWAHSFVESRCASVPSPGELAEIEEVAPLHVIGRHHFPIATRTEARLPDLGTWLGRTDPFRSIGVRFSHVCDNRTKLSALVPNLELTLNYY